MADDDELAMDHVSSFLRNAHESVVESCLVRDPSLLAPGCPPKHRDEHGRAPARRSKCPT